MSAAVRSGVWGRGIRLAVTVSTGVALTATGAGIAAAGTGVATTTVNIRSGAGTGHTAIGGLVRGQRITTTATPRSGWVSVRFAGGKAYMASRYLDRDGRNLPKAPTRIPTGGTKVTTMKVNLRVSPGSRIVGTLPEGRRVTLTGKLRGSFAQVRVSGGVRWVSSAYLASYRGRPTSSSRPTAARPAPRPAPRPAASSSKGQVAVAFAKRQLGKPYGYGSAGPSRYDCSGLTSAAWRAAGVSLPRTSQTQYRSGGRRIAKSELRPGDLVFFYSQSPSHVALYVGNGTILHSPRPGKTVEYSKMSYMPYAGAVRPG